MLKHQLQYDVEKYIEISQLASYVTFISASCTVVGDRKTVGVYKSVGC